MPPERVIVVVVVCMTHFNETTTVSTDLRCLTFDTCLKRTRPFFFDSQTVSIIKPDSNVRAIHFPIKVYWSSFISQWRIQNVQGPTSSHWGRQPIICQIFPENCTKMKKIGPEASLHPSIFPSIFY